MGIAVKPGIAARRLHTGPAQATQPQGLPETGTAGHHWDAHGGRWFAGVASESLVVVLSENPELAKPRSPA